MPDGYQYPNPRPPRRYDHIALVRTIRHRDRLNDWEKRFLISIVHFDSVSQRQMAVIKTIVAKALIKGNPASRRRRDGRAL